MPFYDPDKWETVIGLEVHAQCATQTKLFSNSSTKFGCSPNSNVSFVDAALPGTLPVLNSKCVEQAVKTGIALNAKINLYSRFERKSYFYPDLPRGNQITQHSNPIIGEGYLDIEYEDGKQKRINIARVHLEDDAGKSIHDNAAEDTLIDLNRAGIGLMEIVTAPDFRNESEVTAFLKKLRTLLRYIGVCDGNMEEGSMRCDANVSVRKNGSKELSTKVEIKNLNSIKHISKAISYESKRQIEIIETGGIIDQETRLFDVNTGTTKLMRSKENAIDYRYSPEPDLPPIIITEEYVDCIRKNMKEPLDERKKRYINDLGLQPYDVDIIVSDSDIIGYFEDCIKYADPKSVVKWMITDLFSLINKNNTDISKIKISPENLGKLVNLVMNGKISGKIGKEVLSAMFVNGENPEKIISDTSTEQISDIGVIEKYVLDVLAEFPEKVTEYKNGKDRLFPFFIGQVMKKSGGKLNPSLLNDILEKMIQK